MDSTITAPPILVHLFNALLEVREDLRITRDPWWIIGTAAMALHGANGLQVGDIDILMGANDARRVLAAKSGSLPKGKSRFRSEVYGAWTSGSYLIEVMANLAVLSEERWVAVQPTSRVAVEMLAGPVFIPGVADLYRHVSSFRSSQR